MSFRSIIKRLFKSKKYKVYKGRRKLKNIIKARMPHFFVYVERIGLRSGYRYDVGITTSAGPIKAGVKAGNLNVFAPGVLYRNLTTRSKIRRSGDKLSMRPSAKFTIMQFVAWEHTAFYPYLAGFSYSLGGLNCYTWSAMAIGEAKVISKLPLFP
jgi:hypothetical protein